MQRDMAVAGFFYESDPQALRENVEELFRKTESGEKVPARICMLPHAGHVYSGEVTAKTLAAVSLSKTLIVLCPNHTGYGRHGAVWDKGSFLTPLGRADIAEDIAAELLRTKVFCSDCRAHLREHSIEVILPFLQVCLGQDVRIVPVSLMSRENLDEMAQAVAECMQRHSDLGLIISSDMNHFACLEENRQKDFLALDAVRNLDENELIKRVVQYNISMCGVLGVYIGIRAAKALGLRECHIAAYDTSAAKSGDTGRVVGYAGLYFTEELCLQKEC